MKEIYNRIKITDIISTKLNNKFKIIKIHNTMDIKIKAVFNNPNLFKIIYKVIQMVMLMKVVYNRPITTDKIFSKINNKLLITDKISNKINNKVMIIKINIKTDIKIKTVSSNLKQLKIISKDIQMKAAYSSLMKLKRFTILLKN